MPRLDPAANERVENGLERLKAAGWIVGWTAEESKRGWLWWLELPNGEKWGLERREMDFLFALFASLKEAGRLLIPATGGPA